MAKMLNAAEKFVFSRTLKDVTWNNSHIIYEFDPHQVEAMKSGDGEDIIIFGSGTPVALVRTGAATFAAFSLRCPHEGFTVTVQSGSFYCPAHGARFASTGTWIGGQPTTNLRSLVTTYDAAAGTVTIVR